MNAVINRLNALALICIELGYRSCEKGLTLEEAKADWLKSAEVKGIINLSRYKSYHGREG